jgi:hypothetical protein
LGGSFSLAKSASAREGFGALTEQTKAGINITLAIIASTFIPVCGRLIIEWNESIATYGIYSFAMSLLGIVMVFTVTAGMVIFPLLKKLDIEKLPAYYKKFVFICDTLIYVALLAYIPLVLIIQLIMTQYLPALDYLHILIVMCLPLGRMQLLMTAYYKAFQT